MSRARSSCETLLATSSHTGGGSERQCQFWKTHVQLSSACSIIPSLGRTVSLCLIKHGALGALVAGMMQSRARIYAYTQGSIAEAMWSRRKRRPSQSSVICILNAAREKGPKMEMKEKKSLSCSQLYAQAHIKCIIRRKRIDIRPRSDEHAAEEQVRSLLMHHGRVIKVPAGESLHHGAHWHFIKLTAPKSRTRKSINHIHAEIEKFVISKALETHCSADGVLPFRTLRECVPALMLSLYSFCAGRFIHFISLEPNFF